MQEEVLVVPTKELSEIVSKTGIKEIEPRQIIDLVESYGMFMKRELAEFDEAYRQIIPYVVFRSEGQYLLLKRTSKQSEERLHHKYSLGVGGHVNKSDSETPGWKAFEKGLWREINEEVEANVLDIEYLGIINDMSSEVSRVHLGVLYVAEIEFMRLNEPDLFEMTWLKLEDLVAYAELMEGWSLLALNKISTI